ncbi:hypothetical protein BX600DRAFT_509193 [Xylariales sp. PMI_506]|nr:hypothetical protein BX600DRAFT_509193 [Xylariales sp. PMI_506]
MSSVIKSQPTMVPQAPAPAMVYGGSERISTEQPRPIQPMAMEQPSDMGIRGGGLGEFVVLRFAAAAACDRGGVRLFAEHPRQKRALPEGFPF